MRSNANPYRPQSYQVAIIGGGPAGLACATELKSLGLEHVVLIERESTAGGIPRHCGHSPFGMREFRRCYTGPRYAENLVQRARTSGVTILTDTAVVEIGCNGKLIVSSTDGVREVIAERVVISTGARETPRAARLVTGSRPMGIVTTGALQSMIYLKHKVPFQRPVVVGTELVSFSALLTCHHAGIRPAAMLESRSRTTAWSASRMLAAALEVPLKFNLTLQDIVGGDRVKEIHVCNSDGDREIITCDGVVFTGQFTPEAALLRMGHLDMDSATGGPVVDQYGRCSDPVFFACGNVIRPVETAGWCWREGMQTARHVFASLNARLPCPTVRIPLYCLDEAIRYVVPQIIAAPNTLTTVSLLDPLQLRVSKSINGILRLAGNQTTLSSRRLRALPERRVLFPTKTIPISTAIDHLALEIDSI